MTNKSINSYIKELWTNKNVKYLIENDLNFWAIIMIFDN